MSEQEQRTASQFEGESEHGWSPDVEKTGDEAQQATEKAMTGPPPGSGEGREVSEEERQGVSPTDTEPGSPFGAGESTTRGAEELAAEKGHVGEGVKGESQRPYGTAEASDATGVDPQDAIDPQSPNMPPGDQGG